MAPAMAATNAKSAVSVAVEGALPICRDSDGISDDPTDEDDCPNLIEKDATSAEMAVSDGDIQTSDVTESDSDRVGTEARPAISVQPAVTRVTRETQTETSPVSKEALEICLDVVDLALNKDQDLKFWQSWHPRSDASTTMYQLVNDILDGHSIVYKSMVEKLELVNRRNYWSVKSMCDEVFRGGEISWGRIIAVYAVCVQVARSCHQQNQKEMMAYSMADTIGTYVGSMADEWIIQKGGWNSLVKEFPPKDNVQNQVWKGLLVTGLGLGMFATVIKAIR